MNFYLNNINLNRRMDLDFEKIVVSTETIIAKTNWKVDIVSLFNHLETTLYKVIPKKRGRKSKEEKKEEKKETLLDGNIVTLKLGNKLKGVLLKEKKTSKRWRKW